jgi:lytic murein transglycosylase
VPGEIIDDSGPVTWSARLEAFLNGFRPKALAAGVRRETVDAALTGVSLDPSVLSRDNNQPEFTRPIGDYVARVLRGASPDLYRARTEGLTGLLSGLEARHGVPAEVLVAVWGMESSYGRVTGDMDVVRSLVTMGVAGRRLQLAEQELIAALRILDRGLADRDRLKGSWAGAMGQTQFMPSDYLAYGEDGDGDGRCDIWTSSADALASTANFLQRKGKWRAGGSWAREALLPAGFDYGLADSETRTFEGWMATGARLAESRPLRLADVGEPVQLLLPMGWRGPAFFAFPNHMAIRAYNNSTAYALAVGLLADRFAGRFELATAWPDDPPLRLADRVDAQRALGLLGFDAGAADGVLGVRTRKAVKTWQKGRGLPADGYLTRDLIDRLRTEAGLAAVEPPAGESPANAVSAG